MFDSLNNGFNVCKSISLAPKSENCNCIGSELSNAQFKSQSGMLIVEALEGNMSNESAEEISSSSRDLLGIVEMMRTRMMYDGE
jgi:hypothetical protein